MSYKIFFSLPYICRPCYDMDRSAHWKWYKGRIAVCSNYEDCRVAVDVEPTLCIDLVNDLYATPIKTN